MSSNLYVTLYNGYKVPRILFERVLQRVSFVMDGLEPGIIYLAKGLCGTSFWFPKSKHERSQAGRCVAHLVVMGELPLKFVTPKGKHPKKYSLI